jgi:hypothetical protein
MVQVSFFLRRLILKAAREGVKLLALSAWAVCDLKFKA